MPLPTADVLAFWLVPKLRMEMLLPLATLLPPRMLTWWSKEPTQFQLRHAYARYGVSFDRLTLYDFCRTDCLVTTEQYTFGALGRKSALCNPVEHVRPPAERRWVRWRSRVSRGMNGMKFRKVRRPPAAAACRTAPPGIQRRTVTRCSG